MLWYTEDGFVYLFLLWLKLKENAVKSNDDNNENDEEKCKEGRKEGRDEERGGRGGL